MLPHLFGCATFCYLAIPLSMALGLSGCARDKPGLNRAHFAEATVSGLQFTHTSGARGDYFLFETMGAGAAFFDYDDDGLVDLYLVNGFDLPAWTRQIVPINLARQDQEGYWVTEDYAPPLRFEGQADSAMYALSQATSQNPQRNRLYRNQGGGRFADVTHKAGVGDTGYGMGCAVGDYDNDGHADLYVTNYGPNALYHNQGNGRFADVTHKAGVGDPHWSTSAAFVDYDQDGDLDLYVVNYLDFTLENNRICGGFLDARSEVGGRVRKIAPERRTYCSPRRYNGAPDILYRNEGNGRFVDITREAGVFSLFGKGLGITIGDLDDDGAIDLYIANDGTRNFLYRNNGDGSFTDSALRAGAAYNAAGQAEASMGVDAGDFDNDGDLDLFATHFSRESNTLYRNDGANTFADISEEAGLAQPSLSFLGFGTFFFDADNDGDLDLFVANGHVRDRVRLIEPDLRYAQSNQLFENTSAGTYIDASAFSGPIFQDAYVSRGAAFADIDNDGDLDILVTNCNGPARLYCNQLASRAHWLSLRLIGTRTNRDAIGARVRLTCGTRTQVREVHTSGTYLSANGVRLHFGLGDCTEVDGLEIRWPDGSRQEMQRVPVDRFLVVEQR